MDYFEAVQEGKVRVQAAVDLLQGVVGPCSPLLFLKMGTNPWEPVGEENLYSVVGGKDGTAAVVVCDSEGNSKAMSSWIPSSEAQAHTRSLAAKGVKRFEGEVRLPI